MTSCETFQLRVPTYFSGEPLAPNLWNLFSNLQRESRKSAGVFGPIPGPKPKQGSFFVPKLASHQKDPQLDP